MRLKGFVRTVTASSLLTLVSLTCIAAAGAAKKESTDSVAAITEMLPKLAVGQPKPAWQNVLEEQETDFIRFISSDRVLVGTLKAVGFKVRLLSGLGWNLQPSSLMLLDATTGKQIWSVERPDKGSRALAYGAAAYAGSQQLLATEPVILLLTSNECVAIDPQNGAHIWARGGSPLSLPDGEHLLFHSQNGDTLTVSLVSVRDGKDVWSASVEKFPEVKGQPLDVKVTGQIVLLVRNDVVALAPDTGNVIWREPFPGASGPAGSAITVGDDLYFLSGSSIAKTNPTTGEVVWHTDFPGSVVRTLATHAARALVVLRGGGDESSPDSVLALDRNTGKPGWKYAIEQQTQSALMVEDGRVYFTTPSEMIALDASNGSAFFNAAIPPKLVAHRILPDILRVIDDRVIMARETGVMAVAKRDGATFYAESVEGEPFTTDYAAHKLNHAIACTRPLKDREDSAAQTLAAYSRFQSSAVLASQQALNQATLASNRAAAAMQNANPFAVQQRAQMSGTSYAMAMTDAAMSSVTASIAAITAQEAAVNAEGRTGFRADRMGIIQTAMAQTFQTHASSLQGDFYVRPVYAADRGWSLVVVNLMTGKRAEILLSPDSRPLAASAPNLPAFAIDASGSRIISKGLGLDATRFTSYEKRWFTARSSHIWPHFEKWRIPYPSILAFDVASLPEPSGPTTPAPKPVAPEQKQLNDQLINAAYRCDLSAVEKALNAGADVNAVSDYGQTALMLALESLEAYQREDVIATLLARGANPMLQDPNGWTAADHFAILDPYSTLLPKGTERGLKRLWEAEEGK